MRRGRDGGDGTPGDYDGAVTVPAGRGADNNA
jgi:hypothetical protein